MDKTLQEKLYLVKNQIYELESTRRSEIHSTQSEKTAALKKEIYRIEQEVHAEVMDKYKEQISNLKESEKELSDQLNKEKLIEAKNLWHPHGTQVTLWERKTSWANSPFEKTESKGIVQIYDGTQKLSNVSRYNKPSPGDIIVIHLKKDGSMGLKYDSIFENGTMRNYFPSWLTENETMENNLTKTLRYKQE